MDEKPSAAEAADAPRRRRVPPPTIDLEATQVPAQDENAAAPDSRASESPGEPAGTASGETSSAETSAAEASETSSSETMSASTQAPGPTADPPPAGSGGGWRRFVASIASGVIGAVIALVAAAAAAWVLLGPAVDRNADANARLTRIETQLDALSRRNAVPADTQAPGDMTARLARIESKLAAQPATVDRDVKAMNERLADLTHRNDEIMAASQVARERADAAAKSLADVAQQLTKLNAERARTPQVQRADLDALSTRLANVESATKAIGQQLSRMAGTAAGNTRQAVLAIALNAAVERGAPYARELAAVDPSVAGAATLDALKPFADTGVPSAAALAHELAPLLPAARAAAGKRPPAGGFFQRLQVNAERLMRVRPIGATPGDEPAAVLSRLDAKATRGDIAGALAEAGKLSAAVRAPLDPWIKRATAREAALGAASTLAMRSLDAMGRSGQGARGAQGAHGAHDAQGTQGPAAQ